MSAPDSDVMKYNVDGRRNTDLGLHTRYSNSAKTSLNPAQDDLDNQSGNSRLQDCTGRTDTGRSDTGRGSQRVLTKDEDIM